jgi:extracellular factor (EF) 3-hydroxypalmitic acid methyl ester biosynthesis protein
MVAPGGLLIVTNVDRHSSRAQMECFLEWNLVYRDSQGMRRLAPGSVPSEDVVLKRDETGVNIFLELRKPEHGH